MNAALPATSFKLNDMAEKKVVAIRLLASVAGNGFSFGTGAIVEIDEAIALDLIKAGYAVEIAQEEEENAAKKRGRPPKQEN